MRIWSAMLLLLLLVSYAPVFAQSLPQLEQRPFLGNMVSWSLHFSLGVVVEMNEDGERMLYSFPILSRAEVDCRKYAEDGDEIHLIEETTKYIIPKHPMLYRKPPHDWKVWEKKEIKDGRK